MSIKAVIFDFDGVITESMDIKTDAFAYLFKDRSKEIIDKVVKLHLDNGGMSRFEKFKIIYDEYIGEKLSAEKSKELGREFSRFCFEKMLICPYVNGAYDFIKKNHDEYMFFIVSGTPHDEINKIVDKRKLRGYFKEVLGSPGSKSDLIKKILKKYDLKKQEVVFVGDAPTDYWGAEGAGVGFIARIPPKGYNPFNSDEFKINYSMKDLTSLKDILREI